jgi:hypothetical protein
MGILWRGRLARNDNAMGPNNVEGWHVRHNAPPACTAAGAVTGRGARSAPATGTGTGTETGSDADTETETDTATDSDRASDTDPAVLRLIVHL